MARASLGADAVGGLQQLEDAALVVGGEAVQRQRLLAHHQRGGQPRLLAHPERGQRARRAVDEQADPADLDDRPVGGDRGHLSRPPRRSRRFLACPARPAPDVGRGRVVRGPALARATASASRCWAPPRQTWQMASASASAASAGLGMSFSRSSRVTMAPTCCLVGGAAAGDGRLDLGGRVQRDRQPAAGGAQDRDGGACAVPITVRTLCWLKTRSTATASGRTSSSHCSMPASMPTSRAPSSSSAGGADDSDG